MSLAPAFFLQFVTQFTQTWSVERFLALHVADAPVHRDPLHLLCEKNALRTKVLVFTVQVSNDKELVTVFI